MNGEKPSVYVKRTKINEIFEYCMDNGINFSVQERAMGIDEFEVTMEVENIKKAIQLGFFLRENRIELAGTPQAENKAVAKKPVARKPAEAPAPVQNPLLNTPEPKAEVKPEVKPAPVAQPVAPVANTPVTPAPVSPVTEKKENAELSPEGEGVSLSFDLN